MIRSPNWSTTAIADEESKIIGPRFKSAKVWLLTCSGNTLIPEPLNIDSKYLTIALLVSFSLPLALSNPSLRPAGISSSATNIGKWIFS